jgi:hypothetical protein
MADSESPSFELNSEQQPIEDKTDVEKLRDGFIGMMEVLIRKFGEPPDEIPEDMSEEEALLFWMYPDGYLDYEDDED